MFDPGRIAALADEQTIASIEHARNALVAFAKSVTAARAENAKLRRIK